MLFDFDSFSNFYRRDFIAVMSVKIIEAGQFNDFHQVILFEVKVDLKYKILSPKALFPP